MCLVPLLALTLPVFAGSPALSLFTVENNFLCVRTAEVSENFPDQFRAAAPTNRLSGIILDLRLADGTNASGIASFFAAKKIPVVVLTDAQTLGAAAALAAELHAAGAVVIASGTNALAGASADLRVPLTAEDEKTFLQNPFTNVVASSSVRLSGATNLMFYVDHTSEDELVRKRVKDGEEEDTGSLRAAPAQPVIRDPALARAVDLLKALSFLRPKRG